MARLDGLGDLPITSLELRWFAAADFTNITLPKTLKHLMVWHSSRLHSLDGIEQAPQLSHVELRKNGELRDAHALAQLPALRTLEIFGDLNGNQKITTFDFLVPLKLDQLTLVAIDGRNSDLTPLAQMQQPGKLELNCRAFPREEIAKVAAVNPTLYNEVMNPILLPKNEIHYTRCPGQIKHPQLKGTKMFYCESCDQAAIDKLLNNFKKLVDTAPAS